MKTLAEVERDTILKAIVEYKGNRTKAADALGVSVNKLRNKLAEYATDRDARQIIENADPSKPTLELGGEMPFEKWKLRG